MWNWIGENSGVLQILVGILSAIIWLVYLQVILVNLRRQRRTEILVTRGVRSDLDARCFVSNLGLEPIYVHDLLVTLRIGGRSWTAIVTDRQELGPDDVSVRSQATNQGPIASGDFSDIGSFRDLLHRADLASVEGVTASDVSEIEVVVVASTAAEAKIAAASRRYRVMTDRLVPASLQTRQIRSRRERTRIERFLSAHELASGSGTGEALELPGPLFR